MFFIPKKKRNKTPNGQRLVGFLKRPRFGTTLLGCVPGNEQVSVEWTFTNTSPEPWPVGCRLRYLGGNVKPIYTSKSTTEVVLPRGTNNQTPACFFSISDISACWHWRDFQWCAWNVTTVKFWGDFWDGDLWPFYMITSLGTTSIFGSLPESFGQCIGLTVYVLDETTVGNWRSCDSPGENFCGLYIYIYFGQGLFFIDYMTVFAGIKQTMQSYGNFEGFSF